MDGIIYIRILIGVLLILSVGYRLGWHYGRKAMIRQIKEIIRTLPGVPRGISAYMDTFGRIVKKDRILKKGG